ncbi:MAG TPA: hypothetical protein VKX29_03220 [Brumimicrobium sp.]|nr:hypothetical protein [Brumimicrobium sp.]
MIKRTNFIVLIVYLFSVLLFTSCGTTKPGQTYGTVEEAEVARAKDKKIAVKAEKKAKKEREKHFWNNQSKEAKKRIKKTQKENKRRVRKKRKSIF